MICSCVIHNETFVLLVYSNIEGRFGRLVFRLRTGVPLDQRHQSEVECLLDDYLLVTRDRPRLQMCRFFEGPGAAEWVCSNLYASPLLVMDVIG